MPRLSAAKLTKRTVETAKAPAKGDTFVWDSAIRGFGLRVYASGRRLFVFQYQAPDSGQTRRLSLGEFPAITADHARDLAQRAAGQIADARDPKGNDGDTLQRRTMAEVFPDYLSERRGKIAPRTYAEYQRIWDKSLAPSFGKKHLAALEEAAVARWHSKHHATPIAANRAVDLLSSLCIWSERRGYRAKHSNPCEGVERFTESRKSRSLSADEYRRIGAVLTVAEHVGIPAATTLRKKSRGISAKRRAKLTGVTRGPYAKSEPQFLPASGNLTPANSVTVAALRFLLLSGWRESEALSLRWDAVNFERGVAVLGDTKSGRSERPLGAPALDILRAQSHLEGNPYVFPGSRPGSHLSEPKHVWLSVKETAGLEETAPLRLHDLRHSFTTVARDELGLGDHVIARLVGHKLSGMTSRYGEVRDATVRAAANNISATIATYLSGTDSKILPLKPKHKIA